MRARPLLRAPVRAVGLAAALICCPQTAPATTPVAVDDTIGVPYDEILVVEAPGILANDSAGPGATAELVSGVSHGTLECDSDPAGYDLCPDGSFTYAPGSTFSGFDSFTYQVVDGSGADEATVLLTACTGGPEIFTCWHEAAYRATLGELGRGTFAEGFEDDSAWGDARWPMTQSGVLSGGVVWETNHPATNPITTGTGPALTGTYGVYDPDHGVATGTVGDCDVDDPPPECLFKDGVTGIREPGASTLYAAGGHFKGTSGANLVAILDGAAPLGLGKLTVGGHQFFGVIDTTGFASFRFEEIDGKVGQELYVFADAFVLGTLPADTTPPRVVAIGSYLDTGDGVLTEGEVTPVAITRLTAAFSEPVQSTTGSAPGDVTNPANFLLVDDGGDGFETTSCATGVGGNDGQIAIDWIDWDAIDSWTATLWLNGGVALDVGSYRLLVCGSSSIVDWSGSPLDGNGDGVGGDDFIRNFSVIADSPPVANPDSYSLDRGSTLDLPAPGVLANDTGGGSTLSAHLLSGPSSAASFALHSDGSFSYTHDGLSVTADSFTYRVYDGASYSAAATVTLTIVPVPFTWYVDGAGNDLADCLSSSTPCATVAEAVLRAIDGDTVRVADGVYAESVTLAEDLSLDGVGGATLDGTGGGIVVVIEATATATLSGFEIRGGAVGGVEVAGDLVMSSCWVHANGDGGTASFGGIDNLGTTLISGSTISGNLGDLTAGIANSGQLEIVNSTVHANQASNAAGIDNSAGAIVTLRHSTVAGNDGIGILNLGALTMEASIVAGHPNGNCSGAVATQGHNLEDADSCGLDPAAGDLVDTDPLLAPLADNGGRTPTMAPEAGSPAVDAAGTICPPADQRGTPRPLDGDGDGVAVCDIGAVERAPDLIMADGFETGDLSGWSSATGGR